MTIKEGDKIPNVIKVMTEKGVGDISTEEIFSNKSGLFSVPGAFTPMFPTALTGFIHADQIKDKSVDTIICVSVNDAFIVDVGAKTNMRIKSLWLLMVMETLQKL